MKGVHARATFSICFVNFTTCKFSFLLTVKHEGPEKKIARSHDDQRHVRKHIFVKTREIDLSGRSGMISIQNFVFTGERTKSNLETSELSCKKSIFFEFLIKILFVCHELRGSVENFGLSRFLMILEARNNFTVYDFLPYFCSF